MIKSGTSYNLVATAYSSDDFAIHSSHAQAWISPKQAQDMLRANDLARAFIQALGGDGGKITIESDIVNFCFLDDPDNLSDVTFRKRFRGGFAVVSDKLEAKWAKSESLDHDDGEMTILVDRGFSFRARGGNTGSVHSTSFLSIEAVHMMSHGGGIKAVRSLAENGGV